MPNLFWFEKDPMSPKGYKAIQWSELERDAQKKARVQKAYSEILQRYAWPMVTMYFEGRFFPKEERYQELMYKFLRDTRIRKMKEQELKEKPSTEAIEKLIAASQVKKEEMLSSEYPQLKTLYNDIDRLKKLKKIQEEIQDELLWNPSEKKEELEQSIKEMPSKEIRKLIAQKKKEAESIISASLELHELYEEIGTLKGQLAEIKQIQREIAGMTLSTDETAELEKLKMERQQYIDDIESDKKAYLSVLNKNSGALHFVNQKLEAEFQEFQAISVPNTLIQLAAIKQVVEYHVNSPSGFISHLSEYRLDYNMKSIDIPQTYGGYLVNDVYQPILKSWNNDLLFKLTILAAEYLEGTYDSEDVEKSFEKVWQESFSAYQQLKAEYPTPSPTPPPGKRMFINLLYKDDYELLKKATLIEAKAEKNNEFLLFRGTGGVISAARTQEQASAAAAASAVSNENQKIIIDAPISMSDKESVSLSYGGTILGISFFESDRHIGGGRALDYMTRPSYIGYVIKLPISLYFAKGLNIKNRYFICPISAVMSLFGKGELPHHRTKVATSVPPVNGIRGFGASALRQDFYLGMDINVERNKDPKVIQQALVDDIASNSIILKGSGDLKLDTQMILDEFLGKRSRERAEMKEKMQPIFEEMLEKHKS